jgi:hypothetical protein
VSGDVSTVYSREKKEEEASVCPMCMAGIAQIVIGATATGVVTTFVRQKLHQKNKTLMFSRSHPVPPQSDCGR